MARRSITGGAAFLRSRTASIRTASMVSPSQRGTGRGPGLAGPNPNPAVTRAASADALLPAGRLPADTAPRLTQAAPLETSPQAEARVGMQASTHAHATPSPEADPSTSEPKSAGSAGLGLGVAAGPCVLAAATANCCCGERLGRGARREIARGDGREIAQGDRGLRGDLRAGGGRAGGGRRP
eukprot:scaffold121890_cov48-Phaeocystis_antarctica.AAC.1